VDAAWPLGSAAADVFVFFNNDRGGAAVHNARTLCRMAGRRGMNVATAPPAPA
jgi:cob(I)alamin adenosyltransferase